MVMHAHETALDRNFVIKGSSPAFESDHVAQWRDDRLKVFLCIDKKQRENFTGQRIDDWAERTFSSP